MSRPLPWGRERIEELIPHRDPFLFVDQVVDRSEDALTARWDVPARADWFRGHYPGEPIQPGALICEHVFQVAALLIACELGGFAPGDGVPVLTKIEGARFRRIVRPGEVLTTTAKLEDRVGPAWYMSGHAACGDETVLRIRFVLSATAAMARVAPSTRG